MKADVSARWQGERADILGVRVSTINMQDAVATIEHWIATRAPNYVCITGAHGVIESLRDARLQKIHNEAGLVTPDGMPLVWMARRLGFDRTRRVYGPDLMRTISEVSAARGYKHFFYGGDHGVAERLSQRLLSAHPGLQVVGTITPPFRPLSPEEDAAIIAQINAVKPDIVWVGLSTPKQEMWMSAHVGRVDAPVLIGVGAAFDFLAGVKKQAPRWMRERGLEWLFRLMQEPRRLWRRYLTIVPRFAILAIYQLMRARAAPADSTPV
jgi:N-acetylglucosaminyldiphosphoundecaprenol N-acetyl-beta-D-mannosaminyltransferase